MSTIWAVPVATVAERAVGAPRRMFREPEVLLMPRDARPSRARRQRVSSSLRTGGAASRIRSVVE